MADLDKLDEYPIEVDRLEIVSELLEGKPYYSIRYHEIGTDTYNIGYSSRSISVVLDFIKTFFKIIPDKSFIYGDKIINYSINHDCYPTRAHKEDAGIDLKTPNRIVIHRHSSEVIDLGIKVEIPKGYYGKLESKSGLNVNEQIFCAGGVIDSGYTGTIKVRLYNYSGVDKIFEKGNKVVQLLIVPVHIPEFRMVSDIKSKSDRGDNGFGSSGE